MAAEPDDHLAWLTRWYAAQCDGVWEHSYGVAIGTLDNPGWTVKVDLTGTALAGRPFAPVSCGLEGGNGEPDALWHSCRVADGCFEGAGGAHDLLTVIAVFRAWAERVGDGTSCRDRPA